MPEKGVVSKLSITANGFMNSFRIKDLPGGKWRLIPCEEGEKTRYLIWWEKGKRKMFVLQSCKTHILRQHLSLDVGQFRHEAGASGEMNELQEFF